MNLNATNIPYGVSDFRTIRNEALYHVDKTAYLTTLELVGRYAADPFVPALAKDTELHLILYHFKGKEIFRMEELKG